jgi:hypothetical protein
MLCYDLHCYASEPLVLYVLVLVEEVMQYGRQGNWDHDDIAIEVWVLVWHAAALHNMQVAAPIHAKLTASVAAGPAVAQHLWLTGSAAAAHTAADVLADPKS